MDALDTLQQNQDIFSTTNNPFLYFLRFVGWWIIRGLAWLLTQVENAVNEILNHLNFFASADVGLGTNSSEKGEYLFDSLKPIFWVLLGIGIIIVGYQLMMNRTKSKAQIPMNLVLTAVVIFGMPTLLANLNNITNQSNKLFSDELSYAEQIISSNVTDLKYLDEYDFSAEAKEQKNKLSNETGSIEEIVDAVEQVEPGDVNNSDVFKNILKYDTKGTSYIEATSEGSWLGWMFADYYYRYQINWLNIFVTLIVMIIAVAFAGIKASKIIFNIAYTSIFAMFIAPLDISNGQRTKKIIMEIINMFAVLIAVMFCLKLYMVGMNWVQNTFEGLAYLICAIGFAIAMIGGPDIVQKILGIDAGLGNELQNAASGLYMANAASKGITSLGKKAGGMLAGAGAGAGVLGAGAAGFAKGGLANRLDEMKEKRQKAKGSADSLHGEVIDGDGKNKGSASAALDGKADDDKTLPGPAGEGIASGFGGDSPDPNSDSSSDGIISDYSSSDGNISDDSSSDGNISDVSSGSSDSSSHDSTDSGTVAKDVSSNQGGDHKDTTSTISDGFKRWAGNTKVGGAVKNTAGRMADAYRMGENSANDAYQKHKEFQSQPKRVYGEEVENPYKNNANTNSEEKETIVIEQASPTRSERNTTPNRELYDKRPDKKS